MRRYPGLYFILGISDISSVCYMPSYLNLSKLDIDSYCDGVKIHLKMDLYTRSSFDDWNLFQWISSAMYILFHKHWCLLRSLLHQTWLGNLWSMSEAVLPRLTACSRVIVAPSFRGTAFSASH